MRFPIEDRHPSMEDTSGRPRSRRRRSFLLVELAVAAGVFAASFAAALAIMSRGHAQLRAMRQKSAALELAQAELERTRARLPKVPQDCASEPVETITTPGVMLRGLTCARTVGDFGPRSPGLKQITVTISWVSSARSRKSVSLSCLVAPRS